MVTTPGLLRRNRDFRRFWVGHTISVTGTHVTAVALPLLATLTLDVGAAGVAAVATASYLPNLLLPLLVGHWLERRRRRRVLVVADLVRAGVLLAVPAAHLAGVLSVPFLVAVAFVVGAASVVFEIGGFAYLPTLVDEADLAMANRATQGSSTAAQVAGPGLAGGLAQLVGPAVAVVVDAVSYLASALGVAGAFVGTLLALRLADRLGYGRAFVAAVAVSTVTPLLLAVLPWHGAALAAALAAVQFVSGIGLGSANVLSVTLRQIVAPRGSLARTNGGYRLLIFGVLPLGSLVGGVIGQTAGSHTGVAIGSVGLAVSALPILARRIRTLATPQDARSDAHASTVTATNAPTLVNRADGR